MTILPQAVSEQSNKNISGLLLLARNNMHLSHRMQEIVRSEDRAEKRLRMRH